MENARFPWEPYVNNLPILFARLSGNQRSQGESYSLTVPLSKRAGFFCALDRDGQRQAVELLKALVKT